MDYNYIWFHLFIEIRYTDNDINNLQYTLLSLILLLKIMINEIHNQILEINSYTSKMS